MANEKPLSERWEEIQGSNDWKDLLNPLDDVLRSEIIRYGQFAQVCYDSFDYDMYSRYRGSCKYEKSMLLQKAGLPNTGYRVTNYLYATSKSDLDSKIDVDDMFLKPTEDSDPWSAQSNWMGYVAVCEAEEELKRLGRRDIVVAWRGTVTELDWIEDLKDVLVPRTTKGKSESKRKVKVELGFQHLYTSKNKDSRYNRTSASEQMLDAVGKLIEQYKSEDLSITITGHSLGGALALLSGYDIVESGMNKVVTGDTTEKVIPVTVITFAGPRVGNEAFKQQCNKLNLKTLRIVNEKDLVPKTPGLFTNERLGMLIKLIDSLPWTYSHVGVELTLSSDMSLFLQPSSSATAADHHNLEVYLHLVDGFRGSGINFMSATDRDTALVNKSTGFLISRLAIPAFWRQELNKGLVPNENGKLIQPERPMPTGEYT